MEELAGVPTVVVFGWPPVVSMWFSSNLGGGGVAVADLTQVFEAKLIETR